MLYCSQFHNTTSEYQLHWKTPTTGFPSQPTQPRSLHHWKKRSLEWSAQDFSVETKPKTISFKYANTAKLSSWGLQLSKSSDSSQEISMKKVIWLRNKAKKTWPTTWKSSPSSSERINDCLGFILFSGNFSFISWSYINHFNIMSLR